MKTRQQADHLSGKEAISRLQAALAGGGGEPVAELILRLHPATLADVLESMPSERRMLLWQFVDAPLRGEVLTEVHDEVRKQLIRATDPSDLVVAVERLQLDELADLDADLPDAVAKAVVRAMDVQRRQRYDTVRAYSDDSAGGLMDVDAIAVRADVTLEIVLRYLRVLRRREGALPEHTNSVFVVDRSNRYLGQLGLADLVSLPPNQTVASVMMQDAETLPATLSAHRVAGFFADRDLISAPVVDEDGKLMGRITVDDIVDVIRQEADHSVMSRAGLQEDTDLFAPVNTHAKRRLVWLGVNMINAFLAAWVIGLFDESLKQMVTLAVLMPVVASMGGVAGNQTLTLVTRGLALEQVGGDNAGRLFAMEMGVGLLNGAFLSAAAILAAVVWFQNTQLGLVFGLALVVNLLMGAAMGTLIPLTLNRLGLDPALAGGVVLTAVTDVTGFFSFLGLATWLLI